MASQVQQERFGSFNLNAPIGHNKDDVIVPICPVYTHQQMFKKSFEFGYDYNDVDENGKYTLSFYMTVLYFFL